MGWKPMLQGQPRWFNVIFSRQAEIVPIGMGYIWEVKRNSFQIFKTAPNIPKRFAPWFLMGQTAFLLKSFLGGWFGNLGQSYGSRQSRRIPFRRKTHAAVSSQVIFNATTPIQEPIFWHWIWAVAKSKAGRLN
jgi:hypothetical protein